MNPLFVAFSLFLFIFSQTVLAEDASADLSAQPVVSEVEVPKEKPTLFRLKDDVEAQQSSSVTSNAGTMLAGLMAVLGLIAVLAWASKRLNINLPGSSADMKLVSAMSVGPKEKVMLIEVEGNKLLIGVTSQKINLLKQIDSVSNPVEESNFSQKMQALLKNGESQDV